jgi:hypothetical protein
MPTRNQEAPITSAHFVLDSPPSDLISRSSSVRRQAMLWKADSLRDLDKREVLQHPKGYLPPFQAAPIRDA